jgi:hypothetical protein
MAKVSPGMAAKISAERIGELEYDEPPRRPEGTLFCSGESLETAGRTHGLGGQEQK